MNRQGGGDRGKGRSHGGWLRLRAPEPERIRMVGASSLASLASLAVHSRTLGPGYLEHVYEEAMCAELELRSVPFERQAKIAVRYKGRPIGESRLDLLVAGHLIVELKAVTSIAPIHRAQRT